MKMSELAQQEKAQFNSFDVETMVSMQTLVNEIIEIVDIAYIEKGKFGSVYKVKIQDGTGFFTTTSVTKQLNDYIKKGVGIDDLKGCRFVVVKKHFDADPEKNKPACDYLRLEFVEDTKESE